MSLRYKLYLKRDLFYNNYLCIIIIYIYIQKYIYIYNFYDK